MSTQKSKFNPAEVTNPEAPLTAEEFVLELRALRARIPQPEPAPVPAAIRGRLAHVDPNFVHASINAAGMTPEVQVVLGRTDEDLRAEAEASNRWTAVAEEGRALVKELLAANTIRRQRVGLAALQTYQVCRQLARDGRNATRLAAHIAEMNRLNKFGRARRKPAEPDRRRCSSDDTMNRGLRACRGAPGDLQEEKMVTREMQKIDPAAVVRVVADASASFDATLTPDERAALEKLSANDGDQGLVYSTLEREQALEDFDLLAAADSLHVLSEQIQATIERREQELYRQCLEIYYTVEELARDPANAHLIPVVEELRRAHLAQYGKPIPPKRG